jgi:hypothetical protein
MADYKSQKASNKGEEVAMLSRTGRCALHALPSMLNLLRKLVKREAYLKSPTTVSMADLSDELGPFQMHDLLYRVLSCVSKKLLPAYMSKLLNCLPCEIQQEWMNVIEDLVCSLQVF